MVKIIAERLMNKVDLRVLKGLLADRSTAIQFAHSYDHSLFEGDNQKVGKAIIDYTKSFRSPPTLRTLLDHHKDNSGLSSKIRRVFDEINSVDHDIKEFTYDLGELKKRYQKKIQSEIAIDAASVTGKETDQFFKLMTLKLQDIARLSLSRSYIQRPIGDYVNDFKDKFDNRVKHPEQAPRIKSGYSIIDECCRGLSPAELIMIGGETNAGKSMLLSNMAIQLWLQGNSIDLVKEKDPKFNKGFNIMYFSLEMPYEDCFDRLLSRLADIPQFSISDPLEFPLDDEQKARKELALKFIEKYQEAGYYFDIVDTPRGCTIEEIENRFNDALVRYRPDIVIVDYLGLMHSPFNAKDQDWLKMGALAASLHEFARAYDVVAVTAAQLTDIKRGSQSKESEENKRIGVHRWGRSSLIMHHVNLGIQIETRQGEKDYPDMPIHIVKNRKGPHGAGRLIKNFANAMLIDVPNAEAVSKDISKDIPSLIQSLQKEQKKNENSGEGS